MKAKLSFSTNSEVILILGFNTLYKSLPIKNKANAITK